MSQYSPPAYQSAGSPSNMQPFKQPPAKRQRLDSPPNGLPSYASTPNGLPGLGAYGNPYTQTQPQHSPYASPSTFAASPPSSFNTPQPHPSHLSPWQSQPPTPAPLSANRQMSPASAQTQSSQMMPPPPRPNREDKEERMNIDDIGDSMFGSGVNLKDEENYMHSTFSNRHAGRGVNDSFATTQSTSFGSTTMSPNNSFNLLTQSFGSQPDGPFAGTLGPAQSQEEIENQVRRKRAEAARARNDRWQHHMNHQFLQTNCVRRRIDMRVREHGVSVNQHGLYQRQPLPPQTHVMLNGAGTEGIAAVDTRPEFTTEKGQPYEQLLSLVSLAAGERLRGLLDEAWALARARVYGDHGRVPPEFADIAISDGERREEEVRPENITGSQWDGVPPDRPDGTPQPTVAFTSALTSSLRSLAQRDRDAEAARIAKRSARRRAAEAAAANSDDPLASEAADTPAAETAPSEAAAPKISKKELLRREKESKNLAEANLHSTTNQTAAMMAAGGSRKKKYSWMTGASANLPTNKYAKPTPTASGTSTPNPAPAAQKVEGASPGAVGMARGGSGQGTTAAGVNGAGVGSKVLDWGDFREGEKGTFVEVRDWVGVLERDGKQRKELQRVWNRVGI